MKALSIHQPYADWIVDGSKPVENRNWTTHYRGPLLIHASKDKEACRYLDPESVVNRVFGGIIGKVELFDILHVELLRRLLDNEYSPWLEFCPPEKQKHLEGPYCWCLRNPVKFEVATAYRGQQGLFDISEQELAALRVGEPNLFK